MGLAQILVVLAMCSLGYIQAEDVVQMKMDSSDRELKLLESNNCMKDPLIDFQEIAFNPKTISTENATMERISARIYVRKTLPVSGEKISVNASILLEGEDMCMLLPAKFCYNSDICELISHYSSECPKNLTDQGFKCSCPINAKLYEWKNMVYPIPKIPAGVTGEFTFKITLSIGPQPIGCLQFKVCLDSCSTRGWN